MKDSGKLAKHQIVFIALDSYVCKGIFHYHVTDVLMDNKVV